MGNRCYTFSLLFVVYEDVATMVKTLGPIFLGEPRGDKIHFLKCPGQLSFRAFHISVLPEGILLAKFVFLSFVFPATWKLDLGF